MSFVRRKTYGVDKAIFGDANNTTSYNVTIDGTDIGQQSTGEKEIKSGMFVCKIGSVIRYLPRGVVTTAATTSDSTFVVTVPEVFKTGDVLYPVEPYALVTLGGTIASTESFTITIAGITNTFVSAGTSLNDCATGLAAAINEHPLSKQIVRAVANAATVWIYALDGVSAYSLAVAESSGSGTIAITTGGSALIVPNTAIGTVSSVAVSTGTVTLGASAAIAVPVGMKVGVRIDQLFGLDVSNRNFTDEKVQNIALYGAANSVREHLLPYIDGDIKKRMPRMNFGIRF